MRKEVLNQMFTFIIGAFSLVAALAWNSTIESIFKQIFGTPDKISAKLIYSIFITIIVVIVITTFSKLNNKYFSKE